MATLTTGATQLRQIERQRNLAQALQQQALSFEPIQHPFQGLAKLAQALAARSIEKRAGERETDIRQQEADALVSALGQTPTGGRLPEQPVFLEGIEGPGEFVNLPGKFEMRDKTPEEQLAALSQASPSASADILREVIGQNMLATTKLSPFAMKIRDMQKFLPEPVVRSEIAQEVGMKPVTVIPRGGGQVFTAQELGGRFYLPADITDDNPYGIGADVTDQVIETSARVEAADFSVFASKSEKAEFRNTLIGYRQSVGTLDSIASDIAKAGSAVLSFTGAASGAINTVRSQMQAIAKQVKQSVRNRAPAWDAQKGQLMAEVEGKVVPESQLLNYGNYNISTGTIQVTAQQRQRIRTQAIDLAYAMARAADPGGRLSERDVQAQLDKLGLDQGDYQVTLSALAASREILDRNMQHYTDVFNDLRPEGADPFSFSPVPMSDILLPYSSIAGTPAATQQGIGQNTRMRINQQTNEIESWNEASQQWVPTGYSKQQLDEFKKRRQP